MANNLDIYEGGIAIMQQEPCRVLQVVTSLNPGGIENYLMNLYRHIDRNVLQFDFLVHRAEHGLYEDEVAKLGGRIFRVPRANPLNPNYFREIDLFFSEHPYKVVHVHLDCMSAFVLAAAKKHGATTRIAHSHSSSQDRDLKYPIKLISKRLIPRYSTDLFACGDQAGKWMFNGKDFSLKPNAIDLDKFDYSPVARISIRKEFGIPDTAFLVGHVGRFNAVKNQTFLLDVLKNLLQHRDDVFLMLVGEGEQRQAVEAQAEEMGILSRVFFTGVRDDVFRFVSAFDVFAMPSLYEGLPLVLVEAQASGSYCLVNEVIPSDCDLTDLVVRLPLVSDRWSSTILDHIQKSLPRRVGRVDELRIKGFDIGVAAREMQDFYFEKLLDSERL